MKPLFVICLALAALGCAQTETKKDQPAQPTVKDEPAEPGVPDTEIGLSKTSVFEVETPPEVVAIDPEPGGNPLFRRWNSETPPPVTHGIADHLPIARDENVCIECHFDEGGEGGIPKIPDSHLVDLRHAPDTVSSKVAGARYHCIACHVPQTKATPLVGNHAPVEKK
ncbi:MAG: nitrate reductase cytochrome c-type subunit [Planctomycetota bacterium]|jgi:cytochrome c-type protein NapB